MKSETYFHEDDYNQVEIVPEQNFASAQRQMDSFPPQEEGVMGFSSIVVRDETPINISELKIDAALLNNYLTSHSTQVFDVVKTGYGSYVEIVNNAVAYGFDKLAIVVESTDSIVKNLFLIDYYPPKEKICQPILPVLHDLGTKHSLILVDWNAWNIIRLNDIAAVNNYLEEVFDREE
ncbi:MAG: hypothetical protein JO154_07500 [Chitinophaga sp.]|uniref:hypothetical protein n=1 Tax=Chitinophaga sp. TaxID=1869181 RepID=UPI0025C260BC|nr:hypothetical protein [Chitinophaga sp.]MBV8252437.1 hypothetical protein [Chitinophaga sp.]